MTWCVQCGAQWRPVRAVGYDEDNEPACVGHQARAKKPLNVEDVQTSAPAPIVDETPVAVHSFPPEYKDVPSPGTETPAQEEAMKFETRKCKCCGIEYTPTGAAQCFAPGHRPKRVQIRDYKEERARRKSPQSISDPPTEILAAPVNLEPPPPNESVVMIALRLSQVQKLLELLLQ